MAAIEMDDLSQKPAARAQPDATPDAEEEAYKLEKDAIIGPWAWTSAALLTLMSSILIIFPRILLFAAETSTERRASLTELERFLSLHFAICLAAVAAALVLHIPSAPPPVAHVQQSNPEHPLIVPITGACILSAFISYNTKSVGSLASIVCLGASVVGLWGLWVIIFASSMSVSKKTGADKHTSAFIFGNKAAASKQKKEWKKRQKDL